MAMKVFAPRNTIQGLLTYYISILIFVASCIGIWESQKPLSIIIFLLSLAGIIIQEVELFKRSRFHPHDKQLIEKITERLQSSKNLDFIHEHDFTKAAYHSWHFDALLEFNNDWTGVDYEFVSHPIDKLWKKMRENIVSLLAIIVGEKYNYNPHYFTLVPAKDILEKDPELQATLPERMDFAKTANRLAREIYAQYQDLRKIYIRKTRMTQSK